MDCSEILTGEFEYELIDISWSLDYDFGSMPHATHVADEGEMNEPIKPHNEIEYDKDGIPMGGSMEEIRMRSKIISEFFKHWSLENPERQIFNEIIQENIHIKGISVIEAMEHASKSYKSTKSVFLIDNILKNARPIQRVDVKPGNANQSEFEYMLAMCYKIMELGTVKLMVGVKRKRDEKGISQKVQYSISVLNPEEPFIEQKNNNRGKNAKRKAPHRKR